jgi:hypothetical protein
MIKMGGIISTSMTILCVLAYIGLKLGRGEKFKYAKEFEYYILNSVVLNVGVLILGGCILYAKN